MNNVKKPSLIVAVVLLIAAGQVFGDIYFSDGGTHNINYTIDTNIWADYSSPYTLTTINVLDGGEMLLPLQLQGFNNSRVNILGGDIGHLHSYDTSQVTISKGIVDYFDASSSSQLRMSGGTVSSLTTFDYTDVTISGGNISQIIIYGCSFVTIEGSNFAINGRPVSLGPTGNYLSGQLTGTLANGDFLNTQFQIRSVGTLILAPVPEPCTLAMLGLAGLLLSRRK